MNKQTLITTILGATLLLTACGGGNDNDAREAKMEKEAKKHGIEADVEVDDKGDVKSVTINGMGGTKVGQNLDLPKDFPKDVPLADGWSVMSVSPAPTGGYMVQAMTSASADDTIETARNAMKAKGWTEVAFSQPAPSMTQIGFEKDDRMTNINLIDGGGEQLAVQMLTMDKPG